MLFGLTNTLVAFIDLINRVFRHYLDMFVIVFIYDIFIYSRIQDDHINHLRVVFSMNNNFLRNIENESFV